MNPRRKILLLTGAVSALLVAGFVASRSGAGEQTQSFSVKNVYMERRLFPSLFSPERALSATLASESPSEPAGNLDSSKGPDSPADTAMADAKLIRTGELSIEVQDYDAVVKRLSELVKDAQGYVAEQSTEQLEHGKRSGRLLLRLPATTFDSGLASLKALGKVRSESLNVQDITKEYVDLQARLKVKQETARRLAELLRNRTAKLADVLAAEKELARVTEEIESLEGQRRYYDHQVAFCTLEVKLFEPQALVEPSTMAPLGRLAERMAGTLVDSLSFLAATLAFLAPWGLLAFGARALWKRAHRPVQPEA